MKLQILPIALLALSGCVTYSAGRYNTSVDNIEAFRKAAEGKKIAIGKFGALEAGQTSISCRGAPVKTPDGTTFEDYIRKAFTDELKMAGAYEEQAPRQLTGQLTAVDMSSIKGTWHLAMDVFPYTNETFSVESTFNFSTSYFGDTACREAAQAFVPAVQDLVKKVVSDDRFKAAISKK